MSRGARWRGRVQLGVRPCGCARIAQHQHAAGHDQNDQDVKAAGPQPGLQTEPDEGLDRDRIGDQREEAAGIACGVQKVGILRRRMAGAREPGLQQRPVGREREERQSDRDGEQPEQPERFTGLRRRAETGRDMQRQEEAGEDIHRDMDQQRVSPGREPRDQMRVGIARQQGGLEEHQRDRPDRRGAAELRQHHLGEHRLHREQQRGADEDGGDEGREHCGEIGRIGRRCGPGRKIGCHAIIRGTAARCTIDDRPRATRSDESNGAAGRFPSSRPVADDSNPRISSAGCTSPNSLPSRRDRPRTSTGRPAAPVALRKPR